jgi:catechol 2,3-dioxygenase-like lactoylglutathione lyase family enzyme
MIDHIGIGAKDFEASRQFYDATLAILGISQIIEVTPDQTGGYHGIGRSISFGGPAFGR